MINKDGGGGEQFLDFVGGNKCYEGVHIAHGGPSQSPHI